MAYKKYDSALEALQDANDRIDVALARSIQLEAITDAHHALLCAMAATHPAPQELREHWIQFSSMVVANSQIRPTDDTALEIRAQETKTQVVLISDLLDSLVTGSED